jgi:signal transduction histidine kinase/AraC-like DNA-binding protein
MAAAVLNDAQCLPAAEIESMCQRLSDAFHISLEQDDAEEFQATLEAVLRQVVFSGDDVHVWQAALSSLGAALNGQPAAARGRATELLDHARLAISASVQRQFRRHAVDQRWVLNRLGTLTARLLAAIDETQVYAVLTQHLPAMGIHNAWLALLEAEGDDPVAWTTLRDITSLEQDREQDALHFPSRAFPPQDLLPADRPFNLALFPLTGPRGQIGYVAFDAARLDLCGAITQELATALNSAQLHREATEGRRLAEEANEAKSRFLSTVSHELRTPLNLIVGLSGILLQESDEGDKPLPKPFLEDVEQIYAYAQHLGRMIGDVLDLASSDAGQLRLTIEFVDLSEALHPVAETGRQLASEKGLEWHAELPESGPWVRGDRTRLRQVALNLVSNAVKFTAQGSVRLRLESGPDSVTVSVCDTGLGIPPEEQGSVFGEFQRSERSRTYGIGGLGLGLAISKYLVEAHGGAIGVQSSGREGAGSTFYFTLPTVEPPASQVQPPAVLGLTGERAIMLTNRGGGGQPLYEHLIDRGFDVETVFMDETPDWPSLLVASLPGAIIVDVSTAPHQGWGVLETIKDHPQTEHLPVLVCSLSPDGGSVLEFNYLTKPIEVAGLSRALDQHLLMPDAEQDFKRILVVDDDPNTLEMHARIVRAHSPSHQVLPARNGLEALDLLQREQVDLVLLDLMMPELDGFGVLERMREDEATSRIPVIVLTGQELNESDMERLNQGVATVLSKGLFSVAETLTHVDTALERNRRLSGEAQRLVRQAMAYIYENYPSSISRTDLARHVSLSEDYLTACFRMELGVTPIAYLNRYRVHQAKRLLSDTDKTITEVAIEVGFSDSGYFSRVFRREVGVSPEAYRRA